MEFLLFALGIVTGGGLVMFHVKQSQVPPPEIPPCRFEACQHPPVVIPELVPLVLDCYHVPELVPDEVWDVCVLHEERGISVRRIKAPAPTMLFRERGRKPPVKFVQTGKDADGRLTYQIEVPRGE